MPPSSATPTSNEILVLVDGFSKTSATDLPARSPPPPSALLLPGTLELERTVEQPSQLGGVELGSGQKVRHREAADTTRVQIDAITWNLFHGRDWPPEPELQFRRGRLSRKTLRGKTHVGVNRDLWRDFTDLLCGAGWDIALLQECPPRWEPGFTRECKADGHQVLTSRNWLWRTSWRIARGFPDFIGSSEGGSNLTLVRPGAGRIADREEIELTRRPERRVMALTRLDSGLCVANLHASTAVPQAEGELLAAAERATEFAGDAPLIFGGDFNVRPRESEVYDQLADGFGLAAPPRLTRSTTSSSAGSRSRTPRACPQEARDVPDEETGLAIRLSDHAPVKARFSGMG